MALSPMTQFDPESDIRAQAGRTTLRIVACGSIDDGKSTLIGRLLYETQALPDDQLAALASDSRVAGTRGGDLDFALVTDGLAAEREQGITIDVAYRYLSSSDRTIIMADAPGHEQYTRNMATGASTADLALMLIDARKGVVTQTRRHTYVVSLLGVRSCVVAVNKMDLVEHSQDVYDRIAGDYGEFARHVGVADVVCIPISAVHGDNVTRSSARMPWYSGPTLLDYLNRATIPDPTASPLRFPVQRIIRADQEFRGIAGTVASGAVRVGDLVTVMPSGRQTRIAQIFIGDRPVEAAIAGQSITAVLADQLDVSRGDVIAGPDSLPDVADQFQGTVIWMHDHPMLPGRTYVMNLSTQTAMATIAPLKFKIDVDSHGHIAARQLELNEIGVCDLELSRPIVYEPYAQNRELGGFILIDPLTSETVGAGMLRFALRRSHNLHWQSFHVDKAARARLKGHRPCVLWFTGLSAAGKSTVANTVEQRLHQLGYHTYVLDGDNVRHGLNKDLGFAEADRVENIRRVAEVARLMAEAGLIVLVSFISPFRAERRMARELMPVGEFFEVFVDVPLSVAEARDPKGLYKKARRGELRNFTGIDSPYEPPERPELRIDTTVVEPDQAADTIMQMLRQARIFP
jgi:bifunctional enzyme CysN/CysC